jgi:hypothetical protein
MGEEPLHRLRVSFDELPLRQVKPLDQFVDIIYRSHLEISSIVSTSSSPEATTHLLPIDGALKLPWPLFTNCVERLSEKCPVR